MLPSPGNIEKPLNPLSLGGLSPVGSVTAASIAPVGASAFEQLVASSSAKAPIRQGVDRTGQGKIVCHVNITKICSPFFI